MNSEEIWKVPPGYSSVECSTFGEVRDRKTKIVLDKYISKRPGYYFVKIIPDNENTEHMVRIHILMGLAFLGPNSNGYDVEHKDGDKLNNCIDNLEYCTRSENIRRAYKSGSNSYVNPIEIVETGEKYNSIDECARAINGDPERIRQCLLYPKYRRKSHRGYHFKSLRTDEPIRKPLKVKIVETGETFDSIRDCERAINGFHSNIMFACKNNTAYKDLHFELIDKEENKTESKNRKPFLYPHQKEALNRMFNGCVLNGTVGSGKSRTGLYYYFSMYGGSIDPNYVPMTDPVDLYIITTAKKKNDMEWEREMVPFLLYSPDEEDSFYPIKVVVDSWQCIHKYEDVTGAQFIFDENKINGKGAWAKSFLKITKNNDWIILSASNGDRWEDYETLFLAEGFFKTRTEFRQQHIIYSNYAKFPKVEGYRNETRLFRLRDRILIDMDFQRHTVQHHEDIYCGHDVKKYKEVMRNRWDPFKDEPITQASSLCYVLRKIVNCDESRQVALLELLEDYPRVVIFYNFDDELDILLNLAYQPGTEVAQYNGHKHDAIPTGERWVYLVNYNAAEGWNLTSTNCMVFYSQNYSYKTMIQAAGRIDRLTTPYNDLYYFHLKSRSSIDLAISKALTQKKKFNERRFAGFD